MYLNIKIKLEEEPIELTDYCFNKIIKSEPSESSLILNKLSSVKKEDPVLKEDLLINEAYHDEPFEYGCVNQEENIHLHNKSVTESIPPLPRRSLRRKSNVSIQDSEKQSTTIKIRKRKELQQHFNIGEEIKANATHTGLFNVLVIKVIVFRNCSCYKKLEITKVCYSFNLYNYSFFQA